MIWDITTGRILNKLVGHTNSISSVAFSPNSQFLATGSWDNITLIWNLKVGIILMKLEGHSDYVSSVAFSKDF